MSKKEQKLDGIYVIHTYQNLTMSAEECIARYKSLGLVERAFRRIKTTSLMYDQYFITINQ